MAKRRGAYVDVKAPTHSAPSRAYTRHIPPFAQPFPSLSAPASPPTPAPTQVRAEVRALWSGLEAAGSAAREPAPQVSPPAPPPVPAGTGRGWVGGEVSEARAQFGVEAGHCSKDPIDSRFGDCVGVLAQVGEGAAGGARVVPPIGQREGAPGGSWRHAPSPWPRWSSPAVCPGAPRPCPCATAAAAARRRRGAS